MLAFDLHVCRTSEAGIEAQERQQRKRLSADHLPLVVHQPLLCVLAACSRRELLRSGRARASARTFSAR
jgi:hypothetical protein